jgi:4-amino-4-deoxy-L-arabinose transferase-like glycosyltransferase
MNLREYGVAALAALLVTVPFLNKPVHIDDTFVLHVSARILEAPWNPFGGEINWFGHLLPVWEATTNPPFMSYWLAPAAALSDYSELWMHLAAVPFHVLFACAMFGLARRFGARPWLPTLFLVGSVPFVVSGNLMRDVPAAALATAGALMLVPAVDRAPGSHKVWGGILLGLAILTKYSAAVLLPVLALYFVVARRPREIFWLGIPVALLGLWCVHTWVVYGRPHPWYLYLERSSAGGISWEDKLFGALAILGGGVLLAPAAILGLVRARPRVLLPGVGVLAVLVGWWALSFYRVEFDWELVLWMGCGLLLLAAAVAGARSLPKAEALFLLAWLATAVLFSILFVPFQAVRHLILALPPLLVLLFRLLEVRWDSSRSLRMCCAVLLAAQFGLGLLVQAADYEYAATYRDFARRAARDYGSDPGRLWFIGQWGWKFYAERAGFQMMHRDGPFPREGDLLLWPEKVHVGDAFARAADLRDRLEPVDSFVYPGRIPLRTMSVEAEAGFYAVIRRRIPFRFNSSSPLEIMRVYRVGARERGSGR